MSTLLLVSHNRIGREALGAVLRAKGHNVVYASDSREGIVAAAQQSPDLILVAATMPHIDGLAFLQRLRSTLGAKDIPVMLLADAASKAQVMRVKALDARELLLTTQVSLDGLLARINKHLERCGPESSAAGQAADVRVDDTAATVVCR